ncbi:Splicing factor 3B subunit 2 [Balamuthia mandrillaris]
MGAEEDQTTSMAVAGGVHRSGELNRDTSSNNNSAGQASLSAAAAAAQKKRKRPRKKKKKSKNNKKARRQQHNNLLSSIKKEEEEEEEEAEGEANNNEEEVEVEYVSAPLGEEPILEHFRNIFSRFAPVEELLSDKQQQLDEDGALQSEARGSGKEQQEDNEDEDNEHVKHMSNRQRKKEKRKSVAALKQVVERPDVVEAWDVTAADPELLVYLKSYRNTVPVPRHWCQKRKYLQNKRGIEKPPFELPDFIAATGISRIRQALQEADEQKKAKQKQRERMQPKMGRLDIDYRILHDAFFRYQTKPKLTIHGEQYYEGKEYQVKLKEKRPGALSDELKEALGMPEGAPPPWLINMQRYGPPPSYPNLKIPGLNAPIPLGAQFGYQPGGWGKPPVDQWGRPLYGDVFGTTATTLSQYAQPIERKPWGELEEEEEEEEGYSSSDEEESEEESEEEADQEEASLQEAARPAAQLAAGLATPTGIETPDTIDLRKRIATNEPEQEQRPLFQVLQQQAAQVGSAAFGSAHTYQLPGAPAAAAAAGAKGKKGPELVNLIKSQKTKEVDITLNPSELENLTDDVLKAKYETHVAATQQRPIAGSALDEEEATSAGAATKKKSKSSDKKKYKDFKF